MLVFKLVSKIILFLYIWGWTEKFIWWHICCWWLLFFLPIGSKHCNSNKRSVWTTRETILKNKPHLFWFYEIILISLWPLPLTLIYWFLIFFFISFCFIVLNSSTPKNIYWLFLVTTISTTTFSLWVFHTSSNCGFLLNSECQQVYSDLEDSTKYSSWF